MINPEILTAIPFFKSFDLSSLEILARYLKPRDYWDGSIVFREGEPEEEMFFIRQGRVEVLWEISRNRKVILASIGTGGLFGEMAVLMKSRRAATILVVEDLKVLFLSQADFYRLLNDFPETGFLVLKAIGRNLSNKLRALNQHFLFAHSTLAAQKPANGPGEPGQAAPATLDPEILDIIKTYGEPVSVEPGKVLIHEGGIQHDLYLILEGLAEVTKSIGDNERVLLVHLGPGNLFGEMAFLDADLRSAEVRVLRAMKLYVFHGQKIDELAKTDMKKVNQIYLTIIRHICSNIKATNMLYVGAKRKLIP